MVRGEPRWPMAAAVVAASALTLARPAEVRVAPAWVLPAVEAALLVVLVVRDPGRIDRRSRVLRAASIGAVGLLVLDALFATGRLVVALVEGGKLTGSATALLTAGVVVWVSNIIAFALLYWELDSGGSAARAHGLPETPDIAFPQQLNPELAPTEWRPLFHDYLYLGLTSATAFSPTDAMPLAGWAKLAMSVESLISLTVLGLVVARAVNVLT
ncbi:MAG: hypothetical protein HOQ22_12965 [Nocardioidaceae bacterium]|nr:hypothetical protein [Nocardioidaceae bacterium]NUS51934.1 hypothetical protein [Nocardioidaceae bacterium]